MHQTCLKRKLPVPSFPSLPYLFVGELRHAVYQCYNDFVELIFLLIDACGLCVQLLQPMGIGLDGSHGLSVPATQNQKQTYIQSVQ